MTPGLLPACLAAALALGSAPSLSFTPSGPDRPKAAFEVAGLDPGTTRLLRALPTRQVAALTVFTVDDPKDDALTPGERPVLLGTYDVDSKAGVLRFTPRFPVEPGVLYRAVYRPPGTGGTTIAATYSVKAAPASGPATRVVRVSPTADVLPENMLKFYIEFSAPMAGGSAYAHLRLLDAAGRPLELPFLELGEELWDPRGTRFTLLFDPGRIKKGLKPREELGPVLEAGKTYTLVIDRSWRDAAGNPLAADARKTFRAGPADATPPDPAAWRVDAPAAGTRDPLVVRFPEPLDRGLLGRMIGVIDESKHAVMGTVEVGGDETSWRFTPDAPWRAAGYELRVGRALEDRAGNAVGRPFEVDVFDRVESVKSEDVSVPFRVTPATPSAPARPPRRR